MPTDTYSVAGVDTWTCPAGVTSATVRCWGAGGGAGAGNGVGVASAGGGGGGVGEAVVAGTPRGE